MKNVLSQTIRVALMATAAMAFPAAVMAAAAQADQVDGTNESSMVAAQDQTAKLETITVTATRRVELMKDVPISVTALSPGRLKRANVRSATDLQYLVPNMTFSSTNSGANGGGFQLRGIGTQTYDSGVEQSVGMVVDGVVIGISRDPGITGFGDIAQVEVLRGPQGTLFGRNSTAGVVKITTNNPVIGRTEAEATVKAGSRNERLARGMLNVPLGDNAAMRFAGFYNEQDGAIPYVNHPDDAIGDHRSSGIRGKLEWWITDNLTALLTLEHQKHFSRNGYTIESLGTPSGPTDFATILYGAQFGGKAPDPEKVYSGGDRTVNIETQAASLKLDYVLGGATLTSITAWRKMQTDMPPADLDVSPANLFDHSSGGVNGRQFTQELRLTSAAGEPLEYVTGLFFYNADISGVSAQYGDYYNWLYCGLGQPQCGYMPKVSIGDGYRHQRNQMQSQAAYGTLTWNISDQWSARFGLRYTHDKDTGQLWLEPYDFPYVVLTQIPPYSGEVSGSNTSGRVSLQWKPNGNFMVYATYARGYKGPAIDGSQGIVTKVDPETVNDYELGFKSTLLDGTMALNVTVYQEDFLNFQTQALDMSHGTPVFKLTNAGHMRSRGLELESRWRVARDLTLSLSGAYNDAKYLEYIGACYSYQPVSPSPGPGRCYAVTPGSSVTAANYAGERLANAPRTSYAFGAHYRHVTMGHYAFDASLDWAWRSETYSVTGDPHTRMAPYGLLNLSVGFGRADGSWRVGLFARNLLDKRFYAVIPSGTLNPGGYFRFTKPDAFRSVGVSLGVKM